jgi:hypothetical protein
MGGIVVPRPRCDWLSDLCYEDSGGSMENGFALADEVGARDGRLMVFCQSWPSIAQAPNPHILDRKHTVIHSSC